MVSRSKFFSLLMGGLFPSCLLYALHNDNRYFLFLERPQASLLRENAEFSPSYFMTSANGAVDSKVNNVGIPEIWGKYNLKDVINSVQQVTTNLNGQTYTNPFITILHPEWVNKDVPFRVDGKISSVGASFSYEHRISPRLTLGVWVAGMKVSSHHAFNFDTGNTTLTGAPFTDSEIAQFDQVRRQVQTSAGLDVPDSIQSGLGDADVYTRFHTEWDHPWLLRSLLLNVTGGLLLPSGRARDIDNPASLAFMGNGHLGLYMECNPEVELRTNWHLGLIFGVQARLPKTKTMRLPVGSEPFFYSALKATTRATPGATFKFSPYFTWTNLSDGVDVHVRYTYIHHVHTSLHDVRAESQQLLVPSNVENLKKLSRFRMKMISLEAVYDSKNGRKKWPLEPTFFTTFDFPFGEQKSAAKQHQFTVGVKLHF